MSSASNKTRPPLTGLLSLAGFIILALALTGVATLLTWQREFGFIRTVHLTGIKWVNGYMYEAPLPHDFLPRKRIILKSGIAHLSENGKMYNRAVTFEGDIWQHGLGGYRFEGDRIVFSSLDNSHPDTNGRDYVVTAPANRTTEGLILLCWAAAAVAWALSVYSFFRARVLLLGWMGLEAAGSFVWRGVRILGMVRPALLALYAGQKQKTAALERFSRLLMPAPFFVGIIAGVALCIVLGHLAARMDIYGDRTRFFFKISPEGYVYPTVENICRFVENRASPDKILVLIGGSSIPLGVGQTDAALWSRQLQRQLGDQFAVVNVSFRGAAFTSIGLPLAEMLSKKYKRLYLVTSSDPFQPVKWLRFQTSTYVYPYDYFLWQSWLEGKLLPDPARDWIIRSTLGSLMPNPAMDKALHDVVGSDAGPVRDRAREGLIRAVFEELTYASNLWNMVGYRYFFTVYSRLLTSEQPFWLSRKVIPDDEIKDEDRMPVPQRFESSLSGELGVMRDMFLSFADVGADGKIHFDATATASINALKEQWPKGIPRDHVLFLVTAKSAYTVAHLDPAEQRKYNLLVEGSAQKVREEGFHAIPFGLGFAPDDFVDGTHFSVKAAPKMAQSVAAQLQDMAKKDGWLNEGK